MPKVSVIIPLYNKGPHIALAIKSVLKQTEQNFEIIVVDGHSTDDGPSVVKLFKDSRIFFFEQTGSGVSSARNEGAKRAQSDFFAFLDADDEWMPDHLETLLRLRKKYPEAGAYATAHLVKFPNSKIKVANYHGIPEKPWEGLIPSYFKSAALGDAPVWTSVVGIPKKIFREMAGFGTDTWRGEDTDLWGRIALRYPIAFSWFGVGIYHTEASNRTCNIRKPYEKHIFIRNARKAILNDEVPYNIRFDLLEYVAAIQISMARNNIRIGRPQLARKNLKECSTKKLKRKKYYILLCACLPPRVVSLCLALREHILGR